MRGARGGDPFPQKRLRGVSSVIRRRSKNAYVVTLPLPSAAGASSGTTGPTAIIERASGSRKRESPDGGRSSGCRPSHDSARRASELRRPERNSRLESGCRQPPAPREEADGRPIRQARVVVRERRADQRPCEPRAFSALCFGAQARAARARRPLRTPFTPAPRLARTAGRRACAPARSDPPFRGRR